MAQRGPEQFGSVHQKGGHGTPAELVLLIFAVTLPQFAALTMEHNAGELMAAFATIELHQDAPWVGFVIDKAEQVERLDQSSQLFKRTSQLGWAVLGSKGSDQPSSLHAAELERSGQA